MTIGKVLSQLVTRSPIELLWTAKNGDKDKVLQKIKDKSYAATRDNEKCQVR